MPNRLTDVCSSSPPENSVMMNWPAKARNTPRQKISSECWPQRTAGSKNGDFKPGQSARDETDGHCRQREKMGKAQDVEIGLVDRIQQIAQPGRHEPLERLETPRQGDGEGKQKVGDGDRSTTRERSTPASRCAPPSAHQAPNTNSNCQAKGLKNHTPFG